MRLGAFCGSGLGNAAAFREQVGALGHLLADEGIGLVYGGARVGLMGVLADAVLAHGGEVIGVIPRALVDLEIAHTGLTEQHIVDTMHQRKAMMFTLADAFVVAPGGFGTLEEAFEQLTGIQIGYHNKPVVFYDVDGFWRRMEDFLDHAAEVGVLRPEVRTLFRTAASAEAALDVLAKW